MANDKQTIAQQSEEITRLREELGRAKAGSEAVYPLPHTLRKGYGDLHRGSRTRVVVNEQGQEINQLASEKADNVPPIEAPHLSSTGPSNQDILTFMAGKAIAEAAQGE